MNNFSFPPPPPPPPKAAGSFENSNNGFPQRGRGRGRGDRGGRGDFRGGARGRAQSAGHFGTDSNSGYLADLGQRGQQHRNGGYQSYHGPAPDGAFRGQKRKRDDFQRVSKPQTAPAVPSFGGPLLPAPSNVATKPTLSNGNQSSAQRPASSKIKANALGLTPFGDSSDSEGEDDDEAAMAAAGASSGGLQVSYGGKTLDLGSKETLQAWLAERKRNWPTKARNAIRKQAELKKQQESLRLRLEADQARRKAQASQQETKAAQKTQKEQKRVENPPVSEQKLSKVEKLRLKLEKAEAKAAAKASKSTIAPLEPDSTQSQPTQSGVQEVPEDAPDGVDLSEESSVLSSSDESSDSDTKIGSHASVLAAQEASATKQQVGRNASDEVCRVFAAKGRCPRGRRCPYKHDRHPKRSRPQMKKPVEPPKRKSLFQRFAEQEEAAAKHQPAGEDGMLDQRG